MPGLIKNDQMKRVPKDWGWELWIVNNDLYCGKILFLKAGHWCSHHYHRVKDEVLYVNEGAIVMASDTLPGSQLRYDLMTVGTGWHVVPNTPHQMYAIADTYIYEFSTHHEDSDSYRLSRDLQIPKEELQKLETLWRLGENP